MKKFRWQWALVPALVMVMMLCVILLTHQGIPVNKRPSLLAYLEKDGSPFQRVQQRDHRLTISCKNTPEGLTIKLWPLYR